MLRKRAGFTGEIRATGDVLVDQLQQMARSGFDVAELRADQDLAAGQRQLDRYASFTRLTWCKKRRISLIRKQHERHRPERPRIRHVCCQTG